MAFSCVTIVALAGVLGMGLTTASAEVTGQAGYVVEIKQVLRGCD